MTGDVEVRVSESNFGKGIASARRLHGRYNPSTKSWTIPAAFVGFIGPQNPDLVRIDAEPIAVQTLGDHPERGPMVEIVKRHSEFCPARRFGQPACTCDAWEG